jgi:CHRD domain
MRLMRKLSMAVLLSVAATSAAYADEVAYKATLTGSAEVPPTTSPGKGSVDATLDTSTKAFKWTISYEGLTGPAIAAHFHGPAAVGHNAAPVIPVKVPEAASGNVSGTQTLTDEQISELENGKWYFNVHTAQNKGGEIRGQLLPSH